MKKLHEKVNPFDPCLIAMSIFFLKSSNVVCNTGNIRLLKQHSAIGSSIDDVLSNITLSFSERGGRTFHPVQKQQRSCNWAPT